MYISPRLSKVIIKGSSYVAKSIDWPNSIIRDITLPTEITNLNTEIALSDDFLFSSNSKIPK